MNSDTIKGIIGEGGQAAIGSTIGTMLSTEICDSVRTEFKGPLLETFKGLLTTASEELINEQLLKEPLTRVIESIKIDELKITSGGGSSSKLIGGTLPPIPPATGLSTTIPPAIPSQLLTGIPPIAGIESMSVGSEMLKQMIGGLGPNVKEIIGGLNEALNKEMVKGMLQTAIDKLITHLTGEGKDELVRMFIGILRERINDNYKNNPGDFQEAINTVISGKCEEVNNAKEELVAEVTEGGQEETGYEPTSGGKSKSKKRTTRTTRKIKTNSNSK